MLPAACAPQGDPVFDASWFEPAEPFRLVGPVHFVGTQGLGVYLINTGAGEILLTSMDRDGTRAGFDCELTAAVADAVNIPVIASGGAGGLDHFADVFGRGHADAALAASIFHYADTGVMDVKRYLRERGVPVRL